MGGGSERLYLVVIEIQQGQVAHLTEGSCRDLGDAVPAEAELFQAGRQACGNLLQLVLLGVQVQQRRDLLKHLLCGEKS